MRGGLRGGEGAGVCGRVWVWVGGLVADCLDWRVRGGVVWGVERRLFVGLGCVFEAIVYAGDLTLVHVLV